MYAPAVGWGKYKAAMNALGIIRGMVRYDSKMEGEGVEPSKA